MNISLGFTTWNSAEWIKKQIINNNYFELSDGLIDEIIIQDDCSADYEGLKPYETDNIKVFQNEKHLSPLLSRKNLVTNCKNEWVLVMDCDNFLYKTVSSGLNCFDVIKSLNFNLTDTIYCPGFIHHWGYRELCNKRIDLNFVQTHFDSKEFYLPIFLNTGNYLVPKAEYLKTCELIDLQYLYATVDVIYFNFLWLKQNNVLHCIENYEYEHTFRQDSYTNTHSGSSQEKLLKVYSMYKSI
jgi:glycosyltransferase involved in cell wall biosynthesis